MTEPIKRLFTVSEYHSLGEAGILTEDDRVELIEGEIFQMAAIGSLQGHKELQDLLLSLPSLMSFMSLAFGNGG